MQLEHKHLVRCFAVARLPSGFIPKHPEPALAIILELCEANTVKDLVVKGMAAGRRAFKAKQACEWLLQVASALAHLHSQKPPIIHRDVKPENILLKRDGGKLICKLSDLGLHAEMSMDRPAMLRRRSTIDMTASNHHASIAATTTTTAATVTVTATAASSMKALPLVVAKDKGRAGAAAAVAEAATRTAGAGATVDACGDGEGAEQSPFLTVVVAPSCSSSAVGESGAADDGATVCATARVSAAVATAPATGTATGVAVVSDNVAAAAAVGGEVGSRAKAGETTTTTTTTITSCHTEPLLRSDTASTVCKNTCCRGVVEAAGNRPAPLPPLSPSEQRAPQPQLSSPQPLPPPPPLPPPQQQQQQQQRQPQSVASSGGDVNGVTPHDSTSNPSSTPTNDDPAAAASATPPLAGDGAASETLGTLLL
ncbi:hypothetical protein PLESTB_000833200 [Pleodorina starrii]|uniref:Protein kinase domain-containing protein n=1 Tax=Pleodorina starrii TaxID=330485 RepID=A0A9W6BLY0_9CHLO|nr:hypothetical protein PLESTB_000833200 [Pleodorina starrii]